MSIIDMMANVDWSDWDIDEYGRSLINTEIPAQRQTDLQIIFLGHLSHIRTATPEELREIGRVGELNTLAGQVRRDAKADMVLLRQVWAVEAATVVLADPEALEVDKTEAQLTIDNADLEVLKLVSLRNPIEIKENTNND